MNGDSCQSFENIYWPHKEHIQQKVVLVLLE